MLNRIKNIAALTGILLVAAGPAIFAGGCTNGSKQKQALNDNGVTAEGGLSNVSEVTSSKIKNGLNYPATNVVSNTKAFSTAGPGSQTTLFNQSFGTAMVAGVLKASKVHAVTQENDDITVEGLEIDNSANAAPAWAKAVEPSLIALIQANRDEFIAQVNALEKVGEATAPLAIDLLKQLAGGL